MASFSETPASELGLTEVLAAPQSRLPASGRAFEKRDAEAAAGCRPADASVPARSLLSGCRETRRQVAVRYAIPAGVTALLFAGVFSIRYEKSEAVADETGTSGAVLPERAFALALEDPDMPRGGAYSGFGGESGGGCEFGVEPLAVVMPSLTRWNTVPSRVEVGAESSSLGGGAGTVGLASGIGQPAVSGFDLGVAGSGFSGHPGLRSGSLATAFMPDPLYPERARQEGREGVVRLDVLVTSAGRARSVAVARSSGSIDLDEAALAVVRDRWRFPRSDAEGWLSVRITFDLDR